MNTLSEFSVQPVIRLVDCLDSFIRMINLVQARRLLKSQCAKLLIVQPTTIQFNLEKNQWNNNFIQKKKHKTDQEIYIASFDSELYGNFSVQSPEGHEMFRCDVFKVLWYTIRNLVDIVSESPPTFKLKFTPGGYGCKDDEYGLSEKKNQCVVCGNTKKLSRHHVVPRVFRKCFPEEFVNHNFYDVLLVCVNCHADYELFANKLKSEICQEFNVNITRRKKMDVSLQLTAHTLFYHSDKMPESRKLFLTNVLKKELNKDQITEQDIKNNLIRNFNKKEKHYGLLVVEQITDLQTFVKRWRSHFVETMQPKFLPEFWNIEKPIMKDD